MTSSNISTNKNSFDFFQMSNYKNTKNGNSNNKSFEDFMKQPNIAKESNEKINNRNKFYRQRKEHEDVRYTSAKEARKNSNDKPKKLKQREVTASEEEFPTKEKYENILLQLMGLLESVENERQVQPDKRARDNTLLSEAQGELLEDKLIKDIEFFLKMNEDVNASESEKASMILKLSQSIEDTLDSLNHLEKVAPSKSQKALEDIHKPIKEIPGYFPTENNTFEEKIDRLTTRADNSETNLEKAGLLDTSKIEIKSSQRNNEVFEAQHVNVALTQNNALQDINGRSVLEDVEEIVAAREKLFDQIMEKAKVELVGTKSRMRLNLKPEHLGKLAMDLQVEKGHVIAKVIVSDTQVKQLLETNFEHLKESLSEHGLNIDEMNVTVGQDTEQHRDRLFQNQQKNRHTNKHHGKKSELIDVNYLDNSQSSHENISHVGQLNLMA